MHCHNGRLQVNSTHGHSSATQNILKKLFMSAFNIFLIFLFFVQKSPLYLGILQFLVPLQYDTSRTCLYLQGI